MKRIALLGLACFALSGCGDDKVTKEYLIGKWECKLEQFSAKNENGKLSDYAKEGEVSFVEEYKLEEGKLYSKKDNTKDWVDIDIINRYTGKTDVIDEDEFGSLKVTTLMTKKTDNQFVVKEEFFVMRKNADSKKEYVDIKTNSEGLCTRIK